MTIKDIAELAGVSRGTVDRVLHGRGGVSQKTAARIREMLEQYDYKPNMIASSLALKKKFVIAILVPGYQHENDFWFQPNHGIQEAERSIYDYGFVVNYYHFDQFQEESFRQQFNLMLSDDPDAVLLAPVFQSNLGNIDGILHQKQIPYLIINIEVKSKHSLSYVGQDAFQAGKLAAKLMHQIVDLEKDILIVSLKKKQSFHQAIQERIKGFKSYFEGKKIDKKITLLNLNNKSRAELNKLTKVLLNNHLIKGIFVPSSLVNSIAHYFMDYDLKHIKLIGFDIYPDSIKFLEEEIIDYLITQKAYDQGYKSIRILSDFLLHNTQPEKKYYAPIKIITKENASYSNW